MLEELANRGATPAELDAARKALEKLDLREVTQRDWWAVLQMWPRCPLQEQIVLTVAAAQGRALGEEDAKRGQTEGSAKTEAETDAEGRRRGFEGEALIWFGRAYVEALLDAGFDPETIGFKPWDEGLHGTAHGDDGPGEETPEDGTDDEG
jgi:hypothetical protein